jgi:hypothetical protein
MYFGRIIWLLFLIHPVSDFSESLDRSNAEDDAQPSHRVEEAICKANLSQKNLDVHGL